MLLARKSQQSPAIFRCCDLFHPIAIGFSQTFKFGKPIRFFFLLWEKVPKGRMRCGLDILCYILNEVEGLLQVKHPAIREKKVNRVTQCKKGFCELPAKF